MIKSFYKRRPVRKVFFVRDMKIRSYAYGNEVHSEFLEWRKNYLERWNRRNSEFLLSERGDIGANAAKIDSVAEFRVVEPQNQRVILRKQGKISPLWFEGMFLETNKDGDLYINDQKSDIVLGTELKAWGATAVWHGKIPSFTLFVVGKNKSGEVELRGYPIDPKTGIASEPSVAVGISATLNTKSHLYCFGKHIFLIHESKLHYYYYNTDLSRLEEVAIKTDEPNDGKAFLSNVRNPIVCDSNGFVHWQSENSVYSFPIGFPRRLNEIDLGERNELSGIQCFKDSLFIYRKNKITREFSCLQYNFYCDGAVDGKVFNHGAKYNMFYAEKNGLLYYVKVPFASRRAYVTKNNAGNESVVSEIDISRSDEMFSINGNLYLGCNYIGAELNK